MSALAKVMAVIQQNPTLAAAILGGGAGAVTGGVFSDEGAEVLGAVRGGLMGAGLGTAGGIAAKGLQQVIPSASEALTAGALTGGGIGGLMGGSKPSELKVERMRARMNQQPQEVQKTAEQKQAEAVMIERVTSFEHGMDTFFKEAHANPQKIADELGIPVDQLILDPVKVAQEIGVPPENLTETTLEWMSAELQQE